MKIGITGGIGSGKSYVARLLTQEFGIPVYDCDREARRLMTEAVVIRQLLTALIGADAYFQDGSLNKARVADYLFASEENQQRVNAIVHPVVKADFCQWVQRQQAAVVGMESAILVEAGFQDVVDYLIVVEAPLDLRIQRTVLRDGTTRTQVEQRIARQCDDVLRLQAADYILVNDGRDLLPQLSEVCQTINSKTSNNK